MDKVIVICIITSIRNMVETLKGLVVKHSITCLSVLLLYIIKR